jgi:hypothetical protein
MPTQHFAENSIVAVFPSSMNGGIARRPARGACTCSANDAANFVRISRITCSAATGSGRSTSGAGGDEFAGHGTVNHSAEEYVKTGGSHHTNTVESHFSLLKRGVYGAFHNISEAHLPRYLAEFDFRANRRDMTDSERADSLIAAAKGKRLLYRQPN